MKKTILSSILLVIMAAMLFVLTGCANSKLVATKTVEEAGMKYEQKIEIKFKKKIANEIKMTMTFEDEDTANTVAKFFKDEEGFEQKGKKITMKMKVEDLAKGESKDKLTRDYLKKELKEDGYKVK